MDTELYKNLQLAKTVPMESIVFPCRSELKLDGVRLFLYQNKFYTRKGKYVKLDKIEEQLPSALYDIFVDLEVTLESGKKCDRTTVTGMINSAMKGGHDKIDQSLLYFNVFDAMLARSFKEANCNTPYKERLTLVDAVMLFARKLNFRHVPFANVDSIHQLQQQYDAYVDEGYEGVVAKQYADRYQFKRSKQWARFKPTKTADLLCIGTTEGQGKYEGWIGALSLVGRVEDKNVVVNVGSGLTDDDRFLNPDFYIGKTIEVKYDSVTQDKTTGQCSLFQPRFVCVRIDK